MISSTDVTENKEDLPVGLPVNLSADLPVNSSVDLLINSSVNLSVNLPVDVLPDLHVELKITQTMGLALVDGYRMHLTCMASKSSDNAITYVDMKWSGVGLLQSLWVQNSDVKKQNNDYIERKLFFEPWLDQHAGDYTCHVIVKDNNRTFTVNKTYTVSGKYHNIYGYKVNEVCIHVGIYVHTYILYNSYVI